MKNALRGGNENNTENNTNYAKNCFKLESGKMRKGLYNLSKKDLIQEIECLENNVTAYKQRLEIQFQRLEKLNNYLLKQGLSHKEINKIMQLEGEKF